MSHTFQQIKPIILGVAIIFGIAAECGTANIADAAVPGTNSDCPQVQTS
ncbi:MAG: hypothetical protein AAFQ66_19570 [Pseudomonadota bacterium]